MNSVSAHLPCYLSKSPLEEDFLDSYLTRFFGVRKLKNTSALRVMFFVKIFKIASKFRICKINRDESTWQSSSETGLSLVEVSCWNFLFSLSLREVPLVKGPLKRDFLDFYLTTSFGVRKCNNTSGMKVIFLLKIFKIKFEFRKSRKR